MIINKKHIAELRKQGKSYRYIAKILNCNHMTIFYHLNPDEKNKNKIRKRIYRNTIHPFSIKLTTFKCRKHNKKYKTVKSKEKNIKILIKSKIRKFTMGKNNFTYHDVIKKFNENPYCYLTGEKINIDDVKSYQFDHIIPISKGGNNSIENLGICVTNANIAKNSMMLDEFILLCEKILKHNGYKIKRPGFEPAD